MYHVSRPDTDPVFFSQAEDGIRDLVRSRGLGDVYKRQSEVTARILRITVKEGDLVTKGQLLVELDQVQFKGCLLYTSDAADERSSVDLGGRRIIKKKTIISI